MNETKRNEILDLIINEAKNLRNAADKLTDPTYPSTSLDELGSVQHELPIAGFFWKLDNPTDIYWIDRDGNKRSRCMTIRDSADTICRLCRWEPDRIKAFIVRLRELTEWCLQQRTLREREAKRILESQSESMEWLENEIVAMKIVKSK